MFICNLKIDKKKIWKVLVILLIILTTFLLIFSVIKIFVFKDNINNKISSNDTNTLEINTEEYTNFLKDCHENINNYLGKSIKITGYVYKLPDFTKTQFVLARTMIIDDKNTSVVVGILCENNTSKEYQSGTWLELTGTIQKGNYNGEIPVLEISNIKNATAPEDEFVYLPQE